jgi:cation-transporting ATPase E
VVIFTVPFIRHVVLLEPGDVRLMVTGAVVGLAGAAVIEVVHRVLARWRAGARSRRASQDAVAGDPDPAVE